MQGSFAELFPQLTVEWAKDKNGALTPDKFLPGSHRRVWWRCALGHEWRAAVKTRVSGSGCPVCANRTVLAGENDLATTHPALAEQWNAEKNGALTPQQVVAGSHRRVWWRCSQGHEWQAYIYARASNGNGCPVCAGKVAVPGVSDLASQSPGIASEWAWELNRPLTPERVTPSSNRRVWWRCAQGHEWRAVIAARTRMNTRCPYCAGRKAYPGFNDLATLFPKLAAEWDTELNGPLRPTEVTSGSSRRVWWRCDYGHVWRAAIYSRTGRRKCGCPVCAGVVKVKL